MTAKYDLKSEKVISDILLKNEWAEKIHWDRNDWYIEWSSEGLLILNRLNAILNRWYELDESDKKCVDFMHDYFELKKHIPPFDEVTINMQEEIIGIAQKKMQKGLSKYLIEKIRNNPRSYMALEMIIDYLKSLKSDNVESYLINV
jgi:hypothetical protein